MAARPKAVDNRDAARSRVSPGSSSTSPLRAVRRWFTRVLPRGRQLSDEVWIRRHRGLDVLLWIHVPMFLIFALYTDASALQAIAACTPLAMLATLAMVRSLGRQVRSGCVALGLVGASAVLVYLAGGAIEAHFHFFVVIAFLTLYQEWMPFLIAVTFVLVEHGVIGILFPEAIYDHANMPGASGNPWTWAFVHAGFVLVASWANLLAWRLTEEEAMHDALTGLPNRALFGHVLTQASERRGGRSAAVVVIDLDNFKATNDGLGHEIGDHLLQAITARLISAVREDDVVARLGGDEFGVVLHDVESKAAGMTAANQILTAFDDPFALAGFSLRAAASIGLAMSFAVPTTGAELSRNADLAMYDAKRSGGGRVSLYRPEMHDVVLRRVAVESELKEALARKELIVFYQPLIDVLTGEVVGNEALVRWQHPTLGLVPPSDFIPVAEQSDLILRLGAWVLRAACAQTAAWHAEHPDRRPLTISVNLSPRQLADPQVTDIVIAALRDSDLAPEFLCLEITEGALIDDFAASLPKLRALKTMGVSLALDDFGTGYSSLSYLRQLPVDSLKIDQSFVADLGTERGHQIVVTIIDLAHALGMSVTAEGVETPDQMAVLRLVSANLAQGYLLGRPAPAQPVRQRTGPLVRQPR